MKLPALRNLRRGAERKPAANGPAIRLPRAVDDVYRDMRDRRLLLPAALLGAAIVAVPVTLGASSEEPPAPVPFVEPEGAAAVAPAVLAEEPIGVRDYRDRLDELKSKNPFAGSFTTTDDAADVGAIADPPATPPSSPPGPGIVTPPADAPVPIGPAPSDPVPPAPGDEEPGEQPSNGDERGNGDGDGSAGDSDPVVVLSPRLNVVAGRVGERRSIDNLEVGALLPTRRKAPIAMFLGVSGNLEFAHFAISDDVTDTTGEGDCNPGARDCEFLKLAVGEKQSFVYGPYAEPYFLKVTGLRQVVEDRAEPADE